MMASVFPPPPAPARAGLWLAFGVATQLLLFLVDLATPMGFAHGVLYAPAVALGLLAGHRRAIWLLAGLGVAAIAMGYLLGQDRLPDVGGAYILPNRLVGAGAVLAAAIGCTFMLQLLRHRREAHEQIERAAALLEVSSAVGKLGGWRVELPSQASHWSGEVFRLMGLPVGEVPDIDAIIDIYVPEHRQRVRAAFEACSIDGVPFDEEVQVDLPDRGRRWVRVVGQAVRDARGQVVRVQGAAQDIEAHKQAQIELEQSRAEWRLLADSLPMIVWVAGADGAVTYINQFTAHYVGAAGADLLGDGRLGFVHPDEQPGVSERWLASVASGEPYDTSFRVRRADGAWRWHYARAVRVELPGGGWRWYGTAVDVQGLRDEQQARTELSGRLARTMESVTDAIMILDREWRVGYLNRQAEQLVERRREDLLGRNVWDEFPEARGSVFQQQYERCLRERVTVRFEAEYGPLGKTFEVNAYPGDDGVVVYFRDVTEARKLAEQWQQAQRIDALGQLTGGVAHDFNNLLTVILGNAESLAEHVGADAQQRLMADMITAAAKRGAEMTQRLLAFARKQALEPRPTDVNRLVHQFAPLLQRTLGEHIEIEMVHAAGLWQAQVDPGQLEVALLNLVVNARDAMPAGGRLTIETANTRLDEAYAAQHADLQPGQYVMLAVSDTGHGIAPELLARAFEPFFTTKEVGKGTGLGLPMVYGFVKQSRGHVAIYSEVERGTTVRIYLPRLLHAESAQPARPATATARDGSGQRVLLVEDDDMVRAYARRQVESLGYQVVEAASGPEALRVLAADPEVALLFTDVVMPGGMSGRQLADAAQALRPGLPVLYTSGYTENAIVHHGRLDPGVLLLGKPYLRAELAEKLHQALARRVGA